VYGQSEIDNDVFYSQLATLRFALLLILGMTVTIVSILFIGFN